MKGELVVHKTYLEKVQIGFYEVWAVEDLLWEEHDNNTESKDILNYVTLVAKYYIFCTIQDSDDVPFDGFPSLLKNKLNTSQQIAVKNKTSDNFKKKWKDFIWVFFILLT